MDLRTEVLIQAVKSGVEYIDIEFVNFKKKSVKQLVLDALSCHNNTRLILSAHNFDGSFTDLAGLCRSMRRSCATAVPKIVYTAHHINDCFACFDLLHTEDRDLICMCMGTSGLISRILAAKLGSMVSYFSLDNASATAPGQMTIAQALSLYRYNEINTSTELFGIIADPVGHSLSPAIHNSCFADKSMNRLYLPLLVQGGKDDLFMFLDNVHKRSWLDFRGFSVTLPHKQSALEYVINTSAEVEPLTQKIGAANTLIQNKTGSFNAFNTDYSGAMHAICQRLDIQPDQLSNKRVAIIGAGGVARALTAALKDTGADIIIYNRTVSRAQALAQEFLCSFASLENINQLKADLLINCTSIGMYPEINAVPVPREYLCENMAVFDTIYNPAQTELLKNASAVHAKTIDGLSMFVGQAMAQFELFTGSKANQDLMVNVVNEHLGN
jgi:3-dehydroquinate dehydratase/shikimate dehydrogenase